MTSATQPRTKQQALDVLLQSLSEIRPSISDDPARKLLTEDLLRQVFEVAWQHQFDDDRTETARQIREIVRIAVGLL